MSAIQNDANVALKTIPFNWRLMRYASVPFTVHYRLGDYEDVFRGKLTRRGSEATICEFRVAPNGTFKIKQAKKK